MARCCGGVLAGRGELASPASVRVCALLRLHRHRTAARCVLDHATVPCVRAASRSPHRVWRAPQCVRRADTADAASAPTRVSLHIAQQLHISPLCARVCCSQRPRVLGRLLQVCGRGPPPGIGVHSRACTGLVAAARRPRRRLLLQRVEPAAARVDARASVPGARPRTREARPARPLGPAQPG